MHLFDQKYKNSNTVNYYNLKKTVLYLKYIYKKM